MWVNTLLRRLFDYFLTPHRNKLTCKLYSALFWMRVCWVLSWMSFHTFCLWRHLSLNTWSETASQWSSKKTLKSEGLLESACVLHSVCRQKNCDWGLQTEDTQIQRYTDTQIHRYKDTQIQRIHPCSRSEFNNVKKFCNYHI